MFEIKYTDYETMSNETQTNFLKIEGIEKFIALQQLLYKTKECRLCFGDDQICGIALSTDHQILTVYIESSKQYNTDWKGKTINTAYYVIDFYKPEIDHFDIQYNTHWIDDIIIQENSDGKFSFSFGTGELDFRYSYAKVNRCWCQ